MYPVKKSPILASCVTAVLLVGCGGSSSSSDRTSITSPNINGKPSLENVSAYQASQHSSDMVECSRAFLNDESCDLAVIQPIGVNDQDVTIDQIKQRLVVSHSWMADNFIAALEEMNDQDLLNLFKPLNSVVISYDVRPSFYTTDTASMYIDPRYVWRNKTEWESIYQQDDYRQSFQTEFLFDNAQRYVEQGTNEYVTYSNTFRVGYYEARTTEQIAPGLFRLLAHELAHANDFLPAADLLQVPDNGLINEYIRPLQKLNEDLQASNPITSGLLIEAAQIAFRGKDMTDRVRILSGEEAGEQFEPDQAAAFYSYSHPAEDVAMLFEAYMMYKKYNALSDVAFVSIPQLTNPSCNDWKIQWGQRSRLSDQDVEDRAVFVAERILGKTTSDVRKDLDGLPAAPTAFDFDDGWCDSRQAMSRAHSTATDNQLSQNAQEDLRYLEDFEL